MGDDTGDFFASQKGFSDRRARLGLDQQPRGTYSPDNYGEAASGGSGFLGLIGTLLFWAFVAALIFSGIALYIFVRWVMPFVLAGIAALIFGGKRRR